MRGKWIPGGLIAGGFGILFLLGLSVVFLRAYSWRNSPEIQFQQHNSLGNDFFVYHQLSQAKEEYSAMIALSPKRARGYFLRGQVECELKDYGSALGDAQTALRLAQMPSTRAECYEHIGDYNRGVKDWKRAIADYTEAERRGDRNLNLYASRADCLDKVKQYKRSARDYATAFTGDSEQPYYYLMYADALAKSGDTTGAIKADREVIRIFPESADGWGCLGWHQYVADRIPDAIETNKKALTMNPGLGYVSFNLALCDAVQGKTEAARALYTKTCQRVSPEETTAALGEIEKALKKHPQSASLKAGEAILKSPPKQVRNSALRLKIKTLP